ncbi:MAG: RIP metalloprotease RseP [Lachnospiraceae bacterium]|nr:RIP metalloprotease RseP [Lachnospiraceae bacterium]
MSVIIAILIFSLIVVIHELGHFLLAKKNGIGVTEFSIGMGPRLASFVKNGTRYSLKALPLGGSCMMLGEDEDLNDEGSFNSKPVWARISVIAAGPIFNFVLAFLLSLVIIGAVGYDPASVTGVTAGGPAAAAGLMAGDTIVRIEDSKIKVGREVDDYFRFHPLSEAMVEITYERDGKQYTTAIQPELVERYMLGLSYMADQTAAVIEIAEEQEYPLYAAGLRSGDIITGINGTAIASGSEMSEYFQANPLTAESVVITYERDGAANTVTVTPRFVQKYYTAGFSYNLAREKTGVLGTIRYSAHEVVYWIKYTIKSVGMLFTGGLSLNDMSGPVGIVDMIGTTYEASKSDGGLYVFLNMAYLTILLTANLGVMNLLPIPALDGGRLVFLFIEALRGKPISREKEGFVHMIGLIALMALMVVVFFNDIVKLF